MIFFKKENNFEEVMNMFDVTKSNMLESDSSFHVG